MSRRRVWGCRNKVRFRDHAEAVRSLHHIATQGDDRGGKQPCRAYECAACGGWHLTSKPLHIERAA